MHSLIGTYIAELNNHGARLFAGLDPNIAIEGTLRQCALGAKLKPQKETHEHFNLSFSFDAWNRKNSYHYQRSCPSAKPRILGHFVGMN